MRTISLNIQDKDNQFVKGVQAADLTITEDKIRRNIVSLEVFTGQPVAAVILIDNSETQEFTLEEAILGAQKFVAWNLKNKKDRAALVTFSLEATVEEDLTSDWGKLHTAISRIKPDRVPGYLSGGVRTGRTPPINPRRRGSSASWDAVWASVDGILNSVTNSRRLILLFTDTENAMTSRTRLDEAIRYAATNGVMVYAIEMTHKGYYIVGRGPLTELSEDTGGRSFALKKVQNFPEILEKIDAQARSYYVMGYCAAAPRGQGDPHKVEIDIKTPALREANLRLSYPRYSL